MASALYLYPHSRRRRLFSSNPSPGVLSPTSHFSAPHPPTNPRPNYRSHPGCDPPPSFALQPRFSSTPCRAPLSSSLSPWLSHPGTQMQSSAHFTTDSRADQSGNGARGRRGGAATGSFDLSLSPPLYGRQVTCCLSDIIRCTGITTITRGRRGTRTALTWIARQAARRSGV
ncbi:hypothetical protein B0H12DRAFT_101048 [Mycena haematopus]|nr:hypothetical protein B0H12DRAFT_101048 [Mycena haematopus]